MFHVCNYTAFTWAVRQSTKHNQHVWPFISMPFRRPYTLATGDRRVLVCCLLQREREDIMRSSLPVTTVSIIALLAMSPSVSAWTLDYRFAQRVGSADIPLANGSTFNATPGAPVRLRVQFGVFDDAFGAAPAGGFAWWNNGTISDSVAHHNTRTPGRLPPFNFSANGNGIPPVPSGEPFQMISQISADFVNQVSPWLLDANGDPLPMPLPQVRGLQTFVSVFEFTTTPGLSNYTLTVGGDLIAASSWSVFSATLPDNNNTPLDPSDDIPGSVVYNAVLLPPQSFFLPPLTLHIQVPAPATGGMLAAFWCVAVRRRRQ